MVEFQYRFAGQLCNERTEDWIVVRKDLFEARMTRLPCRRRHVVRVGVSRYRFIVSSTWPMSFSSLAVARNAEYTLQIQHVVAEGSVLRPKQ